MTDKSTANSCDIVIAGGGYVGLCIATAIRAASQSLSVKVIDAAPFEAIEKDGRASAIAAAAIRMLRQLQVWHEIEDDAQPINEMIVTDSRLTDVVRPVFLTFGYDAPAGGRSGEARQAPGGEPFAYMVPNKTMVKALRARALELGVDLINSEAVTGFDRQASDVTVDLASGGSITARLLVAADGARSKLREQAGIRTIHWPYEQSGIVVTVAHERPHHGRAEEHFLPAGPFAILPLTGNRSSLVWTERTADAERLVNADPLVFETELERRFGHHLGELAVETQPRAYPLGLTLARDYVLNRFVLAGDAAHGIHPIAGQGLNLGFKDAAALAETIIEAERLGLDIGSLSVLERYQQWRRFDTVQMGVVTDILNRLFSNDIALVRAIRDFGLGMVDRMPWLKRQFIDQAAGYSASAPRLLKGEAI